MNFKDHKSGSRLIHFWNELKRRKVLRVISVYAAAAFVILEFTSIIVDPLNLPFWTMKALIILLTIVFIITAVFSWIFDITPEGIRRTEPPGSEEHKKWKEEQAARREKEDAEAQRSWFARNKILKRYLIPLAVLGILLTGYIFKDKIFDKRVRVRREARMHLAKANQFIRNRADMDLIRQELDLALKIAPHYDSAHFAYSQVHRVEGDTLKWKKKLKQTLKFNPSYAMAWNNLAAIAFLQDSIDLAMEYTIHAVESDPTNTAAAFNAASLCHDKGLHDQALILYRKAIAIDSTFAAAYSALGSLYNDMKRPVEAIVTLDKSLQLAPLSPHNFLIYKNLAEAHYLLKQYDKAFGYLEQSKELEPDFPETQKCYARYYEATGDISQSISHWQKYLVMETDSNLLRMASFHLDSLKARH